MENHHQQPQSQEIATTRTTKRKKKKKHTHTHTHHHVNLTDNHANQETHHTDLANNHANPLIPTLPHHQSANSLPMAANPRLNPPTHDQNRPMVANPPTTTSKERERERERRQIEGRGEIERRGRREVSEDKTEKRKSRNKIMKFSFTIYE